MGRVKRTRGSDRKHASGRKKRTYWGKKRKQEEAKSSQPASTSASSRKVCLETVTGDVHVGNRIIDISVLFEEIEQFLCCKVCKGEVKLSEKENRGLGSKIVMQCTSCGSLRAFPTSPLVGEKKNSYEVNRRSVLAMRMVGRGHSGLSEVCGLMDLPPPVSRPFYDKINHQVEKAATKVSKDSMARAVKEEVQLTPNEGEKSDITVSGDGSWRKRGFSSLHGLCSVIGSESGKVLDIEVLSRYCRACEKWKGKEETPEFEEWYQEHEKDCDANYQGSAGGMEVQGMKNIFSRSLDNNNVRYVRYIGDGDAKTFLAVKESRPYGSDHIEKVECVGHVQKRMGTRLRKLKKEKGKLKLADGKTLGGKGRLTDSVIDQISQYYGNAIRQNNESVTAMTKAIWAIYFHKMSNDEDPLHFHCPEGPDSWCSWQRAAAKNELEMYKHQGNLPVAVMNEVKKIFVDLTTVDLLKKCKGGRTQNNNESFNSTVWKLLPKEEFSGLTVMKIGVNIAVALFNDGSNTIMALMKELDITPGRFAARLCEKRNLERLRLAELKTQAATLEARKRGRRAVKDRDEAAEAEEGTPYEPGGH